MHIRERVLSLDDLGTSRAEEVIILKRAHTDHWDKGERIPYKDTPTTRRYRKELLQINAWLETADITFDPTERPKQDVDDSDRRLRRYFNNGSFKEGGRLFGGFWLNLTKRQRRKASASRAINSSASTTLKWARGSSTASREPRRRRRMPTASLGLRERHRPGTKKVFNALLYASKPITRFPQETKELFPKYTTIDQVIAGITAEHPAIAHLFCTGIGLKTMLIESNILVGVLLSLIDRKIVALPVHDALVVAKDDLEETKAVMLDVFHQQTGVVGKVELEQA